MHHEYTIETQAKIEALLKVIEQQAKEIEALQSVSKEMARVGMQQAKEIESLKAELEQAWLEYGRATSLACALNN